MKYDWAMPGVKCVCITTHWVQDMLNAILSEGQLPPEFPTFMGTYTISHMKPHPIVPDLIGIELQEIPGWMFNVEWFEPVQDVKDEDVLTETAPRGRVDA